MNKVKQLIKYMDLLYENSSSVTNITLKYEREFAQEDYNYNRALLLLLELM